MIIPVKKSRWKGEGSYIQSRILTAGGYTAVQYKTAWEFWVHFMGHASPQFRREYQATGWFLERVRVLLERVPAPEEDDGA